jgi:uncharacterized SAM-binding protein YcdF (DUF218 family)
MRPGGGQRGGLPSRLVALTVMVALVVVLVMARHPILRAAGDWLVVSDPLGPANAVVVLSGDDTLGTRAARAAELYRGGWAPVVVASGTQVRSYLSEADLTARDLAQDGVPPGAIMRFPQRDLYTLAEARDLRRLCLDRRWHEILVVTSNFHTRRARYIFHTVFPATIGVSVISAGDADFDPANWWQTRAGVKTFAREYAAWCLALWELHRQSLPGAA